MDAYLPAKTHAWCDGVLANYDYGDLRASDTHEDGSRCHRRAYLVLRDEIYAHLGAGNPEGLDLCPRPRGGAEWRPSTEIQRAFDNSRGACEILTDSVVLDLDQLGLAELRATEEQRRILGY